MRIFIVNFKVFHLKAGVDKSFFVKSRPRFDRSIADTYCITRKQLEKAEAEELTKEVNVDQYMLDIAKNCKSQLELGNYLHVANVRAKDIVQALRNTNNINGHWFLTKLKGVEVVASETDRSTTSGDIIEDVKTGYLYMAFGYTFLNIETGELIE
jgi:hypothetical protein